MRPQPGECTAGHGADAATVTARFLVRIGEPIDRPVGRYFDDGDELLSGPAALKIEVLRGELDRRHATGACAPAGRRSRPSGSSTSMVTVDVLLLVSGSARPVSVAARHDRGRRWQDHVVEENDSGRVKDAAAGGDGCAANGGRGHACSGSAASPRAPVVKNEACSGTIVAPLHRPGNRIAPAAAVGPSLLRNRGRRGAAVWSRPLSALGSTISPERSAFSSTTTTSSRAPLSPSDVGLVGTRRST